MLDTQCATIQTLCAQAAEAERGARHPGGARRL
jgi:hypothetical protein